MKKTSLLPATVAAHVNTRRHACNLCWPSPGRPCAQLIEQPYVDGMHTCMHACAHAGCRPEEHAGGAVPALLQPAGAQRAPHGLRAAPRTGQVRVRPALDVSRAYNTLDA